jgi:hypothetical protein
MRLVQLMADRLTLVTKAEARSILNDARSLI